MIISMDEVIRIEVPEHVALVVLRRQEEVGARNDDLECRRPTGWP